MASAYTFLLVPGSHHGGWSFEPVTTRLRALGHHVVPLTLTGVSERKHLIDGSVNLETHITDVTSALENDQLSEVILAGHSYGGMVITGVADRVPARIAALVYLDAFVPQNGDSVWSLTNDSERERYLDGVRADGFSVPPMPFFDSRATAQSLASFLQGIRLTGAGDSVRRRAYVHAAAWEPSPFAAVADRLSQDPDWVFERLESGHNLMRDAPADLVRILLEAAAGSAPTSR